MGFKTNVKGFMYGLKLALNQSEKSLKEKREEQLRILRDLKNK